MTVLGCQLHPSEGVARQRRSDVRGGLLICQTPADTWLKLLPAYPEEGRYTLPAYCRAPGPPEQEVQKATRRRGSWSPPAFKPAQPHAPILSTGLSAGSSLQVPASFFPSSQTTEEQSAAGKRGQWGKRVRGPL